MPKYPYKKIGTQFDRVRIDINANSKDIEADIKEQKKRVDTLIKENPNPDEAMDARGDFDVLRDRLDHSDTQLTQRATKATTTDLQTQINNLVIASGDDPAEVVQARDLFPVLNGRVTDQDNNILTTRKTLYGDRKGKTKIGYYNSSSGNFATGTNWYHFDVFNGSVKNFVLEYPSEITLRVVEFDSEGNRIDSQLISNGSFTVLEDTTMFGVNVRLEGSDPAGTSLTAFDSINDFYQIIIRPSNDGISYKVDELVGDVFNAQFPIQGSERWEDLNETINIGYYASSTGNYSEGVNWHNYFVEAGIVRKYSLKNPITGQVRLVQFNGEDLLSAQTVDTNGVISIADACTHFAINIQLEDAEPSSTTLTAFPNLDGFELHGYIVDFETRTLLSQFHELQKQVESGGSISKRLKFLMLGNSFARDASEHLFDICHSAGIDAVIGFLSIGGQSLEGQWNEVSTNEPSYTYVKWTPEEGKVSTNNVAFDDAFKEEPWDILTFQQGSALSGMYDTFQPYLNNLINHAKQEATNANLKIGLHMTWAYSTNSTHSGFANYDNDQLTMYNAITGAYLQALEETDIDILLPTGTAIQNARTNSYLNAVNDELTRDGYHLDLGIGRYVAALALFEVLFAGAYKKDTLADAPFIPDNGGNKFLAYLSKLAAKNAVLKPFKITEQ
ncbi:DUF4886 domain-containing protein [Halalkalibacter flavus]|uniref:DUF4886 domain-containing protein n=1 Tax=Halalkalibacter flavus TaxID=3090668 RepID=UPI002FC876AD